MRLTDRRLSTLSHFFDVSVALLSQKANQTIEKNEKPLWKAQIFIPYFLNNNKINFGTQTYIFITFQGKNDGMVAGVRYFQTEEKRGVFIRPSKLGM